MRSTLNRVILLLTLACATASGLAVAPADPGGIVVAADSITYFARGGDTLSSIARQFTSRPENWVAIGKLNRIDQDSNIPIGTGILIPAELLADEPSQAKVLALSGTITASAADGTAAVLRLGATLFEGAHIETGANGFVTLGLPDASRISLPSNSRIRLSKLRTARYTKSPRTEIMLLHGRIESRVAPLEAGKGRFEVRTPHSVAGVRGTHFRVGMTSRGSVANEVLSGNVAVGHPKTPAALTLGAGKGNIIDTQTIGPAIDLLPSPQLAGNAELARPFFALIPVAGADAYRVQIATDPDAQNILAESSARSNVLAIDNLPDGAYFIRMSAIDKSGLEGHSATRAFTLQRHSDTAHKAAPGAPFVEQSDDKGFTLRWEAQPGKKFAVQVARDPDFTWLLFNTTSTGTQVRLPRPPFGTYYARVQTIDPDGSAQAFSMAQPFIVTDQWIINDGNPVRAQDSRPQPAH